MSAIVIVGLFVIMVAAPCMIAAMSSSNSPEEQYAEYVEQELVVRPTVKSTARAIPAPPVARNIPMPQAAPPPVQMSQDSLTLREMAMRAESDAVIAQELARQAHWSALNAAARAAALRAEAAAEFAEDAGRQADEAIRAAQAEFNGDLLREGYQSLSMPSQRMRQHAA